MVTYKPFLFMNNMLHVIPDIPYILNPACQLKHLTMPLLNFLSKLTVLWLSNAREAASMDNQSSLTHGAPWLPVSS